MKRPIVVALDGPAGAGKSTVGEKLARRLGYFYFDTGVLYRAVAFEALRRGVDPSDEAALARLVEEIDVRVGPAAGEGAYQHQVFVDGEDVTGQLRTPEVDRAVSTVAASPAVRRGLIETQRRQIQGKGTVMAGRDIGTVVCPDADLKIYLDASPAERARRRLAQGAGGSQTLEQVQAAIEQRDRLDATRALAPLAMAPDAVRVDTDQLTVDEVVDRLQQLLAARLGARERAAEA